MEKVSKIEKNIRNIFLDYPEVIYGFTNIAYSKYASTYKSALVIVLKIVKNVLMLVHTKRCTMYNGISTH